MEKRLPIPPFTFDSAVEKVRLIDDAWNSRDPLLIAQIYTKDAQWRSRDTFITGREDIIRFLTEKWRVELEYKLKKELWTFTGNRIGVKFRSEWHNGLGQWFRSYGNELWQFDESGLMKKREASINDMAIAEEDRTL